MCLFTPQNAEFSSCDRITWARSGVWDSAAGTDGGGRNGGCELVRETQGGSDGWRLFKVARGELYLLFLFLSEGPNDVRRCPFCAVAEGQRAAVIRRVRAASLLWPHLPINPQGTTALTTKKNETLPLPLSCLSPGYLWDANERVSHDLKALKHKGLRHANSTISAPSSRGSIIVGHVFFSARCSAERGFGSASTRRRCRICSAGSEPRMKNAHLNNGRR